jgi:hypothetical protein
MLDFFSAIVLAIAGQFKYTAPTTGEIYPDEECHEPSSAGNQMSMIGYLWVMTFHGSPHEESTRRYRS